MKEVTEKALQRYVSLLSNSGFKAVFGDRKNKDVVMSVINMLLPAGKKVEDIEYAPTEHQGQLEENKEFRYDFMCRDKNNSVFIVEVQCSPEAYWFRRCVSYASRVYDRQNERGKDYDVAPVYLIGLMGTPIRHSEPELWEGRYLSEYTFMEKHTHELQDDTIFIIFAELARFDKRLEECRNDLEKMLYVIKNGWRFKNQPKELQEKIFTRLFKACDIPRFSKKKRIQYEKDMYDERRFYGEIETAKMIGRTEGREEGRAEGRAEGRTEGEVAKAVEIARKLVANGMSKSEAAEFVGIPEAMLAE